MLKLLELTRFPILEQLKIEEALLRNSNDHFCILNYGSKPAYVLPASAKKELWLEESLPHPIVRRYTGGGCVVIDENTLFVTFIGQTQLLSENTTPSSLHRFHEPIYKAFIPNFIRYENDYCMESKKIGGNAQYITKNRFVYHTSFLWDFNPENMKGLKHPPREPKYRKNRPHNSFITHLKDEFRTPIDFFDSLKSQFPYEQISVDTILPFTQLPHRQTSYSE